MSVGTLWIRALKHYFGGKEEDLDEAEKRIDTIIENSTGGQETLAACQKFRATIRARREREGKRSGPPPGHQAFIQTEST